MEKNHYMFVIRGTKQDVHKFDRGTCYVREKIDREKLVLHVDRGVSDFQ